MEQKRLPEPNPMQETISPVRPRRRFGSEAIEALNAFSAAPNTMAAVVVFKNSRRDQRDFINVPSFSSGEVLAYRIELRFTRLPAHTLDVISGVPLRWYKAVA